MATTSDNLRSSFKCITEDLAGLIAEIPVVPRPQYEDIVVLAPNFYFSERTAQQKNKQLQLKRNFEDWAEKLKITFRNAPQDIQHQLKRAEAIFRPWIELQTIWSLNPDHRQNDQQMRKDAATLEKILDVLDAKKTSGAIVVPDTNAIIGQPDPVAYRQVVGIEAFTFMILPTVLSELDKLKNLHKNPDFREKAEKVITRIKGWRKQGSLLAGVTVDRTIQVRALHNEPNMKSTLSWLDPEVLDDRMVASLLEVQAINPTSRIILITGDINLQNKADAAAIENLEL